MVSKVVFAPSGVVDPLSISDLSVPDDAPGGNAKFAAMIAKSHQAINANRAEIARLEEQLREKEEAMRRTEQTIAELQAEIASLNASLSNAKGITDSQADVARLQGELAALHQELDATKDDLDIAKRTKDEIAYRLSDTEERLRLAEQEVDTGLAREEGLERQNEDLERRLGEEQARSQKFYEEFERVSADRDRYNLKQLAAKKDAASLREEVEELQERNAELQEQLDQHREHADQHAKALQAATKEHWFPVSDRLRNPSRAARGGDTMGDFVTIGAFPEFDSILSSWTRDPPNFYVRALKSVFANLMPPNAKRGFKPSKDTDPKLFAKQYNDVKGMVETTECYRVTKADGTRKYLFYARNNQEPAALAKRKENPAANAFYMAMWAIALHKLGERTIVEATEKTLDALMQLLTRMLGVTNKVPRQVGELMRTNESVPRPNLKARQSSGTLDQAIASAAAEGRVTRSRTRARKALLSVVPSHSGVSASMASTGSGPEEGEDTEGTDEETNDDGANNQDSPVLI